MTRNSEPKWLSNEDLGERYNVPLATIRRWRYAGTGPRGVVFGRRVRYSIEEVERWEREQADKQAVSA